MGTVHGESRRTSLQFKMIKFFVLLAFLINLTSSLKVLWIGNSYTYYNDLPKMVARVTKADGIDLEYDSHTEGGWTWEKHAHSQETLEKIYSQKWDVVIMQEQSTRPAYEKMQAALTKSYTTFACMKKPARAAPVGEAFKFVKETQGEETFYSLYKTGGVSDHHPSLEGSYLAALTHYLALYNTNVDGNSEQFGLEQEKAAMLQEAAQYTWSLTDWQYGAGADCDLCMCQC